MCINFYYGSAGGTDILARCFSADFKDTIPEHAVAIVATCVSCFRFLLDSQLRLLTDIQLY